VLLLVGMSALLLALLLADAADAKPAALAVHAWVDVDYALNFNRPFDNINFIAGTGTTAQRANEFNLNAAAVDLVVDPKPVGAHLTLAFGTGPEILHAAEPSGSGIGPSVWRSVYQATVSYVVPVGSGLALEAGIYPSHIGYESFFSKDNWNYTRSWMAELSPYYQTGLKASYAFDQHWSAQLHFMNGWQIIGENNRAKAVGTQISWKSGLASLSFNTFAGPELPRDDSHWRLFGDLVAQFQATKALQLGATADVGWQDRAQNAALWHAAAVYARLALSPLVAIAIRAEYYDDRDGLLSGTAQVLREGTATLELRPLDALIVKLEARHDISGSAVFTRQRDASGSATFSSMQTLAVLSAAAAY
jgi:putative OmpL-like beta-barrel porin-2